MESPQLDNFLSVLHDSNISKKARLVYLDIKAESQLSHGEFLDTDKTLAAKFGMARESVSTRVIEIQLHLPQNSKKRA